MRNRSAIRSGAALVAVAVFAACADGPTPLEQQVPETLGPAFNHGAGQQAEYVPGQILVRFRQGANQADVAAEGNGRLKKAMRLGRAWVVEVEPGDEMAAVAKLARHPHVEFAEPDYIIQLTPCEVGICEETTDTWRGLKWDLHNSGTFFNPTSLAPAASTVVTGAVDADIDWLEMYDYLTTGSGVSGTAVIGILDTGIRKTHTDLAGKVVGEQRFVELLADNSNAGDGSDNHGHGTHVAGIAAARGNNGTGVMGVGWVDNIRLLAVKVCTSTGSCPSSAVANGIIWAVDNGANILNLSLGGAWNAAAGSAAQQAALQHALANNVLPFCATGNDALLAGYNPTGTLGIGFPARFPECVAVGSTNWSDQRASTSSWGFGIELTAPGGQTMTTTPPGGSTVTTVLSRIGSTWWTSDNTYAWSSGTSMASPQAAGLAAMLYALGMTNVNDIRARLQQTTDDKGAAGYDTQFGWGRINAYRAVTGKDPNAPPVSVPGGPYAGSEGSPVAFNGTASYDPNGKPVTFSWTFGDGNSGTGATPSHTYADNGSYFVSLAVTDPSNLTHTQNSSVNIANVAPTVQGSLGSATIYSGGSAGVSASFSDPGVFDAPWDWSITWGVGSPTTGTAGDQTATILGMRQFCPAGDYTVRVDVTDKDGGTGSLNLPLSVMRNLVNIQTPAAINMQGGNGLIPVHVLSTSSFDARTIVPAMATLGDGTTPEAPVVLRPNGTLMTAIEDVNRDGYMDLTLFFDRTRLIQNGDLDLATTQLVLHARLNDSCTEIRGVSAVKVVP